MTIEPTFKRIATGRLAIARPQILSCAGRKDDRHGQVRNAENSSETASDRAHARLLRPAPPINSGSTALAANQERVVAELDRVVAELEGARGTLTRLQYQTTLALDGLPIPPPEFHAIVSGTDGLDAGMFLNIGESCCNGIRRILAKNGIKLEQFARFSILDADAAGSSATFAIWRALGSLALTTTPSSPTGAGATFPSPSSASTAWRLPSNMRMDRLTSFTHFRSLPIYQRSSRRNGWRSSTG